MTTWSFVEREAQSYDMSIRLWIEGVEVTDWVQDEVSVALVGSGGENSLSFTLANPDDIWMLTAENLAGQWRKSGNLYSEAAKKQIYERKKARDDEARVTMAKYKVHESLRDTALYGLGPHTAIFHKHDCVRLFVRHPMVYNDWWMVAFTGFVNQHPFTEDYITGSRPISLTCYCLKGIMRKMRVNENPIPAASRGAALVAFAGLKQTLTKDAIIGPEAGPFEDLLTFGGSSGMNHPLVGKNFQQCVYLLTLGEGSMTAGSDQSGDKVKVKVFDGMLKQNIRLPPGSANNSSLLYNEDEPNETETRITEEMAKVNAWPVVRTAGGISLLGGGARWNNAALYSAVFNGADSSERKKLYDALRTAEKLGQIQSEAQVRKDIERKQRQAQGIDVKNAAAAVRGLVGDSAVNSLRDLLTPAPTLADTLKAAATATGSTLLDVGQTIVNAATPKKNAKNPTSPSAKTAMLRGHVGRLTKGETFYYSTENPPQLEAWHNLCVFGNKDGYYLTYDQCTLLGQGTVLENVEGSPYNGYVHMLLPEKGLPADGFAQSDWEYQHDMNSEIAFATRYDLIERVNKLLEFQWWCTPWGDVVFEFPCYDFAPQAFGSWAGVFTLNKHAISASIEDEATDVPTALVVTGQEKNKQASATADGVQRAMNQNRVVVYAPMLAARSGVIVEPITAPTSLGGQVTGGNSQERLEAWGAMQLSIKIGESSTMNIPMPFRPWITPNRPIEHILRKRIGLTHQVTHAMAVGGVCTTTPQMKFVRKLANDGKYRYPTSGGENMPISYATMYTKAGDTKKSAIDQRGGVYKGDSLGTKAVAAVAKVMDVAQTLKDSASSLTFQWPIDDPPKRLPKGYKFGEPRKTTNPPHGHMGIDLGVFGSRVLASAAGTVHVAKPLSVLGGPAMIYINHKNGWQTRYFHLDPASVCVKVRDSVKAGQLIARVGYLKKHPHVHFEIARRGDHGVRYDPEAILRAGGKVEGSAIDGIASAPDNRPQNKRG